ncbi:MAG: acetyl-CoA carboxylase biotin carboxyl carrier protein [Gemmatimonadales bacterium]|nr:acetyl-CoA carboxylase biotin carboxyl carrier protein [Gemmatimonadales bacterium]
MKKKNKPKASAKGKPAVPGDRDLAVLEKLLSMLDGSSAATIKLERGGTTYEVSRGSAASHHLVHSVPGGVAAGHSAPPVSAVPPAGGGAGAGAVVPPAPPSNLIEIKSPMVGTFYRAPEPGAEPYVKVGSRVSAGQTLCIIEAMKIMNEIESEVTGTVREIQIDEAQPVEFGQVLFRVEPNV